MHPKDAHHLLALLLVTPLVAAAPIFPNSNDIDENGYFLPEGHGPAVFPEPGFTGPKARDLEVDVNHAIDEANQAIDNIAQDVDPKFNPPEIPHLPSKRDGVLENSPNSDLWNFCDGPGNGCDLPPEGPWQDQGASAKEKRDIIGTLEGFANNAINTVEQGVNSIFHKRDLTEKEKRDIIGTLEGFANNAINTVEQGVNSIIHKRDLTENEKRDIIGTLEGFANNAINSVEQSVNSILHKRDFVDDGHWLPKVDPFVCAGVDCEARDTSNVKRDIIGTLEGFANTAVNTVEQGVNSIFHARDLEQQDSVVKRDIIHDVEGVLGSAVHDIEGLLHRRDFGDELHHIGQVIEGTLSGAEFKRDTLQIEKRDIIGTLEGFANNAINTVEGALNSVVHKRDLVGDLNGAIDSANQVIGTIAGDVDSKLNPPDIPHIPTKRMVVGPDGPFFTNLPPNVVIG